MNARNTSQRAFLAVTMMTVLAVTTVFMVYAVLLASYQGGLVTIEGVGGSIEYSLDNSTNWGGTLSQGAGAQWYARIAITNSPTQDVIVTWTLYNVTGASPVTTDFTDSNTISLTPLTTHIYASLNGLSPGNHNWGDHTTTEATYRIDAVINTV